MLKIFIVRKFHCKKCKIALLKIFIVRKFHCKKMYIPSLRIPGIMIKIVGIFGSYEAAQLDLRTNPSRESDVLAKKIVK